IGIWAEGFEKLQIVPLLLITPLTFLGGTFYSTSVLPPVWQKIALFNPVVYLISGFRWSFFEIADVSHSISVGMTLLFLAACLVTVWWMFKTGNKLKKQLLTFAGAPIKVPPAGYVRVGTAEVLERATREVTSC